MIHIAVAGASGVPISSPYSNVYTPVALWCAKYSDRMAISISSPLSWVKRKNFTAA